MSSIIMRMLRLIIVLLLTISYPMFLFAHPEGTGKHVVAAYRIEGEPPQIDGVLDDTAWQQAEPQSNFIQLEPARGAAATDDTEFRIAYDAHNIYVAFRCYDAEPDKIVNRMTRRGDVYASDVISFFLDPHHDHRTGYKFATNPAGVQSDNYRYEDTQRDSNWKGIWWVESNIDESGWSAEFKIPFSNFRFTDRPTQIWGFDVERVNRRKSEVTVWKQLTQAGVVTRMSDLGHIVGIHGIETGKNFEITPYALGGAAGAADADLARQLGTGLDVQYSLTSALKANVTVNPDFAQVEADQLEINLTRFPTRFPEKRPFFVEGNSFFETPYDLMFSRRIGSRGNILWGGKLTGKVGNYSIGVLGNQTGEFTFSEDASSEKEAAWFSAIRIKRDILKRSNVGILLGNKERPDGDSWTHSRVGGIDMNLALGKTYHLSGQYAGSFHPGEDQDNFAYTVDFAQRNYLWSSSIGFERVAPHFEINQTGFLRKERNRGWQRVYMRTSYSPYWGARQFFSGITTRLSQSLYTPEYFTEWRERNPKLSLSPEFDEDLFRWHVNAYVGMDFRETLLDDITAYYYRSRQVELTEIFIADGYGFSIDTDSTNPIAIGIEMDFSDYFNFGRQQAGKQRSLTLESTLRPQSNFSIELGSSYAQSLDLEGAIDGRFFVSSLRATYLFTRESFLRMFAQASRERPLSAEIHQNYLLSFLFGWEYSPKSHLFLAYNETWADAPIRTGFVRELQLENRVVVVKVTYLYNL
ncbi:MAG: DUF5916 domain-containing protein [Candidatus Poribacteria bacterium]|nr:DUF5916 domain-containing protein [Candidatus Poribacteria bacterium]